MEDTKILDLIFDIKQKCMISDEALLKSLEISRAEYNMFLCLTNCTHFNSYSVSEKMHLSLSRVSRIIDKMVSKGCLSRTTNKHDRRAIDIKLTEIGKEKLMKISQYREDVENTILSHLQDHDVEQLKMSLAKLAKAI